MSFKTWGWILSKLGLPPRETTSYGVKCEDESTCNYVFRHILGWVQIALIVSFFVYGSFNANDSERCRVRKFADVVITFPYALGCNLFKDRYDIKLN